MSDPDILKALERIEALNLTDEPSLCYLQGFEDAREGVVFDMTGIREDQEQQRTQLAFQLLIAVVRKFGNFVQEARCEEDKGGYAIKLNAEDLEFGNLNFRMEQDPDTRKIRLIVANPSPEYRGDIQEGGVELRPCPDGDGGEE